MPTPESAAGTTAAPAQQKPRRSRPPSQYWDYRTASWQTVSAIPVPRRGQ
jgi:hypothetical protein